MYIIEHLHRAFSGLMEELNTNVLHHSSENVVSENHTKYFKSAAFRWACEEIDGLIACCATLKNQLADDETLDDDDIAELEERIEDFMEDIGPFWYDMIKDDSEIGFYKTKLEKLMQKLNNFC